jgi:23S rRNA pseudouridine1911/1915/1917 synthase
MTAPPRRLRFGLVILYEDMDIIVVDKPSGLLSIAAGGEREKTCCHILAEYLRKNGGPRQRPAVVHRLVRGTSGVMIFAKSEKTKKKLMDNWNEAVAGRRYIAVAEGNPGRDGLSEGTITAPLGEDRGGRVVVSPGGKPAVTRWKVLKAGKVYSLLSLELETGRRNQIRAHLSWLGCPVAGDKKYHSKTDPLKRLCLHAEYISFRHPRDGRLMEFETPPDGSFHALLRS